MYKLLAILIVTVVAIPTPAYGQRRRQAVAPRPQAVAPVQRPVQPQAVSMPKAQEQPVEQQAQFSNEVDTSEVMRWGDRVIRTYGYNSHQSKDGGDQLFAMAMAPPVDDNDQHNITVWGPSNDPTTVALVKSFQLDPNLTIFVASPPNGPAGIAPRPWAHFTHVRTDDVMQAWRVKASQIDLKGPFPIITIMPPRNGHKGDPAIVIDRIDLGTAAVAAVVKNPSDLRKRIIASIDLYTKKLAASGFQPPREAVVSFYGEEPRATPVAPAPPSRGGPQQNTPWGPNPPSSPVINPQWPVNGPANDGPIRLTLRVIKDALGSDVEKHPEFLLDQISKDNNTLEKVELAWLIFKQAQGLLVPKRPAPAVQPPEAVVPNVTVQPTPVTVTPVLTNPEQMLLKIGSYAALVIMLLRVWETVAPLLGYPGTAAKLIRELIEKIQENKEKK